MAAAGVQRLADMQLSDGGWGWFSGFGEHSWPHTTAVVVHGLQIARQNDVALPAGHARARHRLAQELPGRAGPAARERRRARSSRTRSTPTTSTPWSTWSWSTPASATTRCATSSIATARSSPSTPRRCSAWPCDKHRQKDKLAMILQNIEPVRRPGRREPDGLPQAARRATTGGTGTAARSRPTPTTSSCWPGPIPRARRRSRLVKYLLNNRKHAHLLEQHARHGLLHRGDGRLPQGQRRGPARHDGRGLARRQEAARKSRSPRQTCSPSTTSSCSTATPSRPASTRSRSRKQGTGPLYFNAYLTNFTLEDSITKRRPGGEGQPQVLQADRATTRRSTWPAARGQAVGQKVEKYAREPTAERGDAQERRPGRGRAGDRQQERLRVPDLRGHEGGRLRAGRGPQRLQRQRPGRLHGVARRARGLLRRGRWPAASTASSYRLRAEIPGKFHALPARA